MTSAEAIAIGVDAGGTSITAVVSRGGNIIAEHRGTGSNVTTDREISADMIADIIRQVIAQARIQFSVGVASALTIVVGAAGAGDDAIRERITVALQECFPLATIRVVHDAEIALRAGVPYGDGIVVIAGTGSIAYAEIAGVPYRAGGYGYLFGDAGSGFALGSAAVQHMLRVTDGRTGRDAFADAIAKALGSNDGVSGDMRAMVRRMYGERNPVPGIARLAPLVIGFADRGDKVAQRIVQRAALDLAGLVKHVMQNGAIDRELPLVFSGGLFRANSLLTYLLESRILNEFPLLRIVKHGPEPHLGALRLAEVE